MNLAEFLKEKVVALFESALKPALEVYAKGLIEAKSDEIVEKVLAKVKDLIPGEVDNMLIDAKKAEAKKEIKEFLLLEADKISPLV